MDAPEPEKPKSPWPTLAALFALFAFVAWLLLVGHHRHRLEFIVNGKAVTLTSRKSPWAVERPDAPAAPATYYGLSLLTTWHGAGSGHVTQGYPSPESCSGFGILHHTQHVEFRNVGDVRVEFSVNGWPFVLTNAELRSGDRAWPLSDVPTVVDVDALP